MNKFVGIASQAIKEYTSKIVSTRKDGKKTIILADCEDPFFSRQFEFEIDPEGETVTAKDVLSGVKKDSPLYQQVVCVVKRNPLIVKFTPGLSEGNLSVTYNAGEQDKTEFAAGSVGYCVEKLILVIHLIYERVYRAAPSYTLTQFNEEGRKIMGLEFVVKARAYDSVVGLHDPFKFGAKGDFALTLPNKQGDYFYRDTFWGATVMDNVSLPLLAVAGDGNYFVFVEGVDKANKPRFLRIDLTDLQTKTSKLADMLELVIGEEIHVDLVDRQGHRSERGRRIPAASNKHIAKSLFFRPTHPLALLHNNELLGFWIAFIESILERGSEATHDYRWVPITTQLALLQANLTEEQRQCMLDLAKELKRAKRLGSTLEFQESWLAGRIAAKLLAREKWRELYGEQYTFSSEGERHLFSNIRKISHSGGGCSVYLGTEELKAIDFRHNAVVSVIQDAYGKRRILVEPIEE